MKCTKCNKIQDLQLEMIDMDLILIKDNKKLIDIKIHCQDKNCGEVIAVAYVGPDQIIELNKDDDCNHPAAAVCQYNDNGKCKNKKGCNFKY